MLGKILEKHYQIGTRDRERVATEMRVRIKRRKSATKGEER